MKVCKSCGVEKETTEFTLQKHKHSKDSYLSKCKVCVTELKRDLDHTIKGKIYNIYSTQKRRSKIRGMDQPNYTFQEFIEWCKTNGFTQLFNEWKEREFIKEFAPSADRIDDYKPYTFDNLRLVTWKDNHNKFAKDMIDGVNTKQSTSINKLSLDGVFIANFKSIAIAYRSTGVSRGNICMCCKGQRNTAGGFVWEYATLI